MRHFVTTGACLEKLFSSGPLVSLEVGSCECCNDELSELSDDSEHPRSPPAQTRGLASGGISTSDDEPGGEQGGEAQGTGIGCLKCGNICVPTPPKLERQRCNQSEAGAIGEEDVSACYPTDPTSRWGE